MPDHQAEKRLGWVFARLVGAGIRRHDIAIRGWRASPEPELTVGLAGHPTARTLTIRASDTPASREADILATAADWRRRVRP